MYNSKNYTEQGGETTHIGGTLIFDEGGSIEGFPGVENMAPVTGNQVKDVKDAFNELLIGLKDAGLMIPDEWNVSIASATLHNLPTAETLANSGHATVTIDGTDILIALDCEVKDLADANHGETWGTHKWLGFGVTSGLASVEGIVYSDTGGSVTLTAADTSEASSVGLSAGDFILYIKAEKVFKQGGGFTLKYPGKAETEFTLTVTETKNEGEAE